MSCLTLFAGDRGWLATDRLVYAAHEVGHLESALRTAERLANRLERFDATCRDALERERRKAREEGLAEGRTAARHEVAGLLGDLLARRRQLERQRATASTALALDIVRHLAGEIAPGDWLRAQAGRAIDSLEPGSATRLRIGGGLAERLDPAILRDEAILVDGSLPPDACVLEGAEGAVRIDLETQLDEIARVLEFGDES